ncbi:hypothetical protein DV737_g4176, partial [Chaetothyriales sp. CBS 132003]
MWTTFVTRSLTLLALGKFALSSAIVDSSAYAYRSNEHVRKDDSPNKTLAAAGYNFSGPIPIGDPKFTCQVFSYLFPQNETFSASSSYYTPLYEIPWSQTCWLEPACIVTPTSPTDVSKVMLVLRVLNTTFAIRSGGHSVMPGFAGVGSNGVLVALQNLNTLSISDDNKIATVGTGNRWGNVYKFAADHGVSVVGGREPMVGVGGLLLGGVVTDFDLETNEYTKVYFEIYLYSPSNTSAVLQAYANYMANPNTDVNTNVEIQVTANFTLVFLGYNGWTNKSVDFEPFYTIPPLATYFPPTNGTINDVVFGVSGNAKSVGSTYDASLAHEVGNGSLLLDSYQIFLDLNQNLPSGMYFSYAPQGISPNLVNYGKLKNGGNLLNLQAVPQIWVDIFIDYADTKNTDIAKSTIDAFVANLTQKAEAQGLLLPYLYANNAADIQKPLRGYGEESFKFIQQVAQKYDPDGVLQKLQNGGFLYSRE